MTRLFLDGVRQKPWLLGVSAVLFVQQFAPVVTFDFIPRREPDGGVFFSVLMWFFGFQFWSQQIARHVADSTRAIRAVPVGVRDAARAYWLAAVVPPAIVCGVTIVAGLLVLDRLDTLEGSGGPGFEPLSLFLLWGVTCAATIACVGLAGNTRSTVARELGFSILGIVFLTWAYMRTEPPPLGTAVANADLLVATLLVAMTALSYILAPRIFEHAPARRRTDDPTGRTAGAPVRLASGATGAIEPWVRTFVWALGLGLLLSVPSLAIPAGAFPRPSQPGLAVLASFPVFFCGAWMFTNWMPSLRALRVLPISQNRLPLLLFGQPACVYAGALVGAGLVSIGWPDGLAWLGPLAVLLVALFGLTLSGLSILCGFGVGHKESQLRVIFLLGGVAIGFAATRFRSESDAPVLDWVGGALGVAVVLAVIGFLVLRAAISRRGSLYRS
ncbi:MAG: hypothetical protein E2P06_01155 [Acidobacteria bacterium]|nr:MAG: hypothetical protein E2P06_01155 [Acidobacteriota bacterium]